MSDGNGTAGLVRAAAAAAAVAALLGAVPARAIGTEGAGPIPPFTVVSPDGRAVPSASLTAESQWVLVSVRPGSKAASSLLEALAGWQFPPAAAGRLVFVVEGPLEQAGAYMAGAFQGGEGRPAWYADPDGQAGVALGATGSLTLHGIRGGAIQWTVDGVLGDPAACEPVLRTWAGAPAGR